MEEELTIRGFQKYIKSLNSSPDKKEHYFYKLIEEMGELSEVIRKNKRLEEKGKIKGTIEEEIYDVFYYTAALANAYGIDLEQCFKLKEELKKGKRRRKADQSD